MLPYFTASVFLKMSKDMQGTISIPCFHHYIVRKNAMLQTVTHQCYCSLQPYSNVRQSGSNAAVLLHVTMVISCCNPCAVMKNAMLEMVKHNATVLCILIVMSDSQAAMLLSSCM